jgi:hypothetical protein
MGGRINILLNACPAYLQTKLDKSFLLAEKAGLVWKFAGQAFNKLLILPPFLLAPMGVPR